MMARNFGYLLSLIPALVAVAGNLSGGVWALSNILFSLLLVPLADLLAGRNTSNRHSAPDDPFPAAILYLHVLTHTAVVVSLVYGISAGILSGGYIVAAAVSSGIAAGSGAVVVAHELIHKASPVKRMAGDFLLAMSGNFYFKIHHLRIHHRDAGLHADAATARRGESLYAFFVRTLAGQIRQGWGTEARRLAAEGKNAWSPGNEIFRNLLVQLMWMAILTLWAGWPVLMAWLLLMATASFLLEYVNYIEHYGLERNKGEKMTVEHSWNCDRRMSRFMLVDLSRHADHHFYASKPYHTLNTHPASPELPGGYAGMILPALIPPLWFAMVHPRLDSRKNRI